MKAVKAMRQKLQTRTLPTIKPPDAKKTLKFASFNVNGLDLEGVENPAAGVDTRI